MSTRSSARNLFPPLDNLELTIRRRSRADPTLLNGFEMANEGNGDLPVPNLWTIEELCQPSLNGRDGPIAPIAIQAMNIGIKNDTIQQSIRVNGVTDDALRLYLFTHSLKHHATAWFDRLPRNSINTFEQMAKRFLGKYFPSSMVTKLRNEITNFRQRPDESLFEAWEHYKLSIDRSIAITFDLPTVKPKDSLRMGDEHLDTISEIESDEFIKSSVENLVPSPRESEDLSDSECDVPSCDDFITFSNLLLDADGDFSSSDNELFFDEDISKKIYSDPLFDEEIISMKIDPHHFNAESDLIESLLNHDSSIISSSSRIDSLLDEFAGELILLKTIPPGIDETNYDPEEEIRLIEKLLNNNSSHCPPEEFPSENSDAEIKSFSPFPIPVKDSDSFMKEIDLSFTPDDPMPLGIEEDDYDSEKDMLIFEELLSNDSLSLLENELFHFDIPSFSRPPAKPPDDDSGILTVIVMDDISEHDVPMPKLLPTQPTLISNQEKSPHLLSHLGFKAFQLPSKIPMMSYGGNTPILDVPFFHFYPP
nr:hypothetical protein [Tanacetum cinerariifolium]